MPGDIKVKDLLVFFCRWNKTPQDKRKAEFDYPGLKSLLNKQISQLESHEAYEVGLSLLRVSRGTLYLIHDLTGGIPMTDAVQFKHIIDQLTQQGAIMIYLTTPYIMEVAAIKKGCYFIEGKAWIYALESRKKTLEVQGTENIEKKSES